MSQSRDADFNNFITLLIKFSKNDSDCSAFLLSKAADKDGAEFLKNFLLQSAPTISKMNYNQMECSFYTSILHQLALREFIASMNVIIQCGFDVDHKAHCDDFNNKQVTLTALLIAIKNSLLQSTDCLLKHGASLLEQLDTWNIFHLVTSPEICDLLLEEAHSKGHTTRLLLQEDHNKSTPLMRSIIRHNFSITENLFTYMHANNLMNDKEINHAINFLVAALVDNPEYASRLVPLIKNMYGSISNHEVINFIGTNHSLESDVLSSCHELYGRKLDIENLSSRDDALKLANAYCHAILSHPKHSEKLLEDINVDFGKYYRTNNPDHPFPFVPDNQFEYRKIQGIKMPVPKIDSDYFNEHSNTLNDKRSALKHYLCYVIRKEKGLGDIFVRWVGVVEYSEANKNVENNDIIIESSASRISTLHGVYTHALQLIMLLFAINSKLIPLTYTVNQEKITLLAKEIFACQTRLRTIDNLTLWAHIRDGRLFNGLSFTDPHHLSSYIMQRGNNIDLLSNYLIDSTCKSFAKLYLSIKSRQKDFIDYKTFIKIFLRQDMYQTLPINSSTREAINKYEGDPSRFSVFSVKSKTSIPEEFAVVKLKLNPNTTYT